MNEIYDKPLSFLRADGLRFFYNGSVTINVYEGEKNIDCFTLGNPPRNLREVVEHMHQYYDYRKDEAK